MPDPAHQTNPQPYPAEVTAFGDALEEIMRAGDHDLAALAAGLAARGIRAGGHAGWTPESLAAYLAELASA